jgi:hypothetical protein
VQADRVKSFTLSPGPCITNASYSEWVGGIDVRRGVSTPRTDDYTRHFHSFRYTVNSDTPVGRVSFYTLGADVYNYVKSGTGGTLEFIFMGDASGAYYNRTAVPSGSFDWTYEAGELRGNGPFWFALTGGASADHAGRPRASRGLVVVRMCLLCCNVLLFHSYNNPPPSTAPA